MEEEKQADASLSRELSTGLDPRILGSFYSNRFRYK